MLSRIEKLLNNIGEGRAAFISGGANIRYYSGFTSEDAFLIISRDRRMLVTDSRYYVQARQQSPEFDLVKLEDGWEKMFASVPEDEIAFEENIITCGFYDRLKKKAAKKSFVRMQKPARLQDPDPLFLRPSGSVQRKESPPEGVRLCEPGFPMSGSQSPDPQPAAGPVR